MQATPLVPRKACIAERGGGPEESLLGVSHLTCQLLPVSALRRDTHTTHFFCGWTRHFRADVRCQAIWG